MVRYVVQAQATGLGFVDCKTAENEAEALRLERELREDDAAWMAATTDRITRVVPAEKARCNYNR